MIRLLDIETMHTRTRPCLICTYTYIRSHAGAHCILLTHEIIIQSYMDMTSSPVWF